MRQSALDKAIANLEEKGATIMVKANLECQALDHAILSLKAQKVKQQASRPRSVAAMPGKKVG